MPPSLVTSAPCAITRLPSMATFVKLHVMLAVTVTSSSKASPVSTQVPPVLGSMPAGGWSGTSGSGPPGVGVVLAQAPRIRANAVATRMVVKRLVRTERGNGAERPGAERDREVDIVVPPSYQGGTRC